MCNVRKGVQSGYSVEELYGSEALLLKPLQLNPFIIHSLNNLNPYPYPYPFSFSLCVHQCAL